MNKIEKIVSDSRTQKEAVAKIMAFRDGVSAYGSAGGISEMEIAKAVKDIKNGHTTTSAVLNVVGPLLFSDRKYRLERTKELLESKTPAGMIQKLIDGQTATLAEWLEKAKADPFYQLSWGGKAFMAAAERKVYLEIQYTMKRVEENTEGGLTAERWAAILDHVRDEAIGMASSANNSRSTSQCFNLADDCLMAAKANIARGNDWAVSEITWWFKEREKFEREWAEVYG